MTARQLWEYALIEINKVEAPSMLLEDFNYYINKAVMNYIDKRYNMYDMNQQLTDDLRVLKGTAKLDDFTKVTGSLLGATYVTQLPEDYFHILSCVVVFTATKPFKCYSTVNPTLTGAKRLTADMFAEIINNYYLRPSYRNPYYYIHNSTDPVIESNVSNGGVSSQDPTANQRDGNLSPVNIEIRYGKDDTLFTLTGAHVDYLKVPRYILLTQDQIDLTEDTSSVIEFPNYVCYEIIKELVALLLESASDPRLNTNIPINKTIPDQAPQPQQGKR